MVRHVCFLLLGVFLWPLLPVAADPAQMPAGLFSRQVDVFPGLFSDDGFPVPDRIEPPVLRNRRNRESNPQLVIVNAPAFAVPLSHGSGGAVSLQPGDVLPIVEERYALHENRSTHFYVTVHPEIGLATVSTRFAAEQLEEFPADWFELPGLREDVDRIVFATRPRKGATISAPPLDEELLAIPAGDTLHTDRMLRIDLATEFSGGAGVATFSPLSLRVEDITGDSFAELAIDSRSHTVAGPQRYSNETIETFWLTASGGTSRTLLHLVHETQFNASEIQYTHSIVRNRNDRVEEIRSYARRRFAGGGVGLDKSVQRYRLHKFEWIPGRTRLTGISPKRNPAGLRREPDPSVRITDWLPDSIVSPVDVHIDETRTVWLKVHNENGPSGWIEESQVKWHRHR